MSQSHPDAEARYRLLFESIPLPAWVYDVETLAFLEVNEAAVRHYGYRREQFLCMTLRDVRPSEDVPQLLASVAGTAQGRNLGVFRHRLADGRLAWMEVSSQEMQVGGRRARLVVLNDVTERHEAEAREHSAHQQLATLVQSAPVAIVSVDLEYRVTAWNAAAERTFGWRAQEVLGCPVPVIPPEQQPLVERMWREQEQSGRPVQGLAVRRKRKDGSDVEVLLSTALVHDARGQVAGRTAFFVDLTEQKRLEEQVRQAQKMEAVGQLAGGIAHDFNNLLTVICSNAQLALEELPAGSPVREDVEEVSRAAARATALTRQLLAFSRRQVLRLEVLDLNLLVADAERMLRRLVRADIRIVSRLAAGLGEVRADRGQIEQVLLNLAVNARDAMPHGGTLTLHTAPAELAPEEAAAQGLAPGAYARLSVQDTGVGMDAPTRQRIFEPFFTTKPVGQGTGLGLATVYGIVKQLGGGIEVQSRPGEGTTFTLLLPLAPPGARGGPVEPAGAAPASLRARPGEALLVVEDEEQVRASVCRLLERQGYRVHAARSGPEALRQLEVLEAVLPADGSLPVQLVLTDLMMPELGGRELVSRLRERWPRLRALFMSGYEREAGSGVELPGELLQKPFSTELLLRRVREALDA